MQSCEQNVIGAITDIMFGMQEERGSFVDHQGLIFNGGMKTANGVHIDGQLVQLILLCSSHCVTILRHENKFSWFHQIFNEDEHILLAYLSVLLFITHFLRGKPF